MKNSNWILSVARIWGFLSLAFLSIMLLGHIFGEDTIVFSTQKEMLTFVFFPLGILFGIFVAYRSAISGGLISAGSTLISCIMIPQLIINLYFIFSVLPGILFLIYGLKSK